MWFLPPLWVHTDRWYFSVSLQALCSPDTASYFVHSAAQSGPGYLSGCSGNDLWSPFFSLLPPVPAEGFPPANKKQRLLLCWFPCSLGLQNLGLGPIKEVRVQGEAGWFLLVLWSYGAQPLNLCVSQGFGCEYTVTQSRCSESLDFDSWWWMGLFEGWQVSCGVNQLQWFLTNMQSPGFDPLAVAWEKRPLGFTDRWDRSWVPLVGIERRRALIFLYKNYGLWNI